MTVADLNFILSLGVVAMQIASIVLLAMWLYPKQVPNAGDILPLVKRWGLQAALLLSAVGATMTLVYSDILGFEPCPLCWWQRIFLYPQVILFGMALWKEKYRETVVNASIALSVFGLGFALYHHVLQMMPAGTLPCPATGPSCAQITFIEFGYVTFPMMAVALFGLLIVTGLVLRSRD